MSERDMTAGGGSSPYDDEPTGVIPEQSKAGADGAAEAPPSMRRRARPTEPDRDSFFARHARDDRASGDDARLTRVDDLDDDLDDLAGPGEVGATSRLPVSDEPETGRRSRVPRGRVTPDDDPVDNPDAVPTTRLDAQETTRLEARDAEAEAADGTPTAATTALPRKKRRWGRDSVDDDSLPAEERYSDRDELIDAERRARRGTLDIGLLVLRVGVGVIMVLHGCQKLFGWWNGPRLSGFEDMLANPQNPDIGFSSGVVKPLAILGALSETLGGLMLIVGLFTPLAAAAVLGVMLVAAAYKATLSGGVWFFASGGGGAGIEYELLLVLCAVAILLTGPGRLSLDATRGWARRPSWGSLGLLIVGVAAAVAVWLLFNGTNPFTPNP